MIEEVVIKQISDQNARIAEIYKHKIWANNKSAVLKLKNRNFESLMTDQDFIQFAKKSSQFFNELKTNISLYDKNGRKFIESQSNDFLNVKLNENDSNYGATEDNLRPLYAGSWSNDDFEKRLDKLNNNLSANQLKTKRTYSTSRSDFGEYIFILKSLSLPLFISFKIFFYFEYRFID